MPIIFSTEGKDFFVSQLAEFRSSLSQQLFGPILSEFQLSELPPALGSLNVELINLQNELDRPTIGANDTFAPLVKLIILSQRQKLAADIDSRRGKTTNPEVIQALKSKLRHFDIWMQQQWL